MALCVLARPFPMGTGHAQLLGNSRSQQVSAEQTGSLKNISLLIQAPATRQEDSSLMDE